MKPEFSHVRNILINTISLLCKNSLTYQQGLRIHGLLGITLDEEVFLVEISEHFGKNDSASCAVVTATGVQTEDDFDGVAQNGSENTSKTKRRKRRSDATSDDSVEAISEPVVKSTSPRSRDGDRTPSAPSEPNIDVILIKEESMEADVLQTFLLDDTRVSKPAVDAVVDQHLPEQRDDFSNTMSFTKAVSELKTEEDSVEVLADNSNDAACIEDSYANSFGGYGWLQAPDNEHRPAASSTSLAKVAEKGNRAQKHDDQESMRIPSEISTVIQTVLSDNSNTVSDDPYLHSINFGFSSCAPTICNSNLEITGIYSVVAPTRANAITASNDDERGLSNLHVSVEPDNCSSSSHASQLALMNEILTSHALGACLLGKTELRAESRSLLTDIVANYMLVNIERPAKNDYMKFASAITAAFPKEYRETYFIPSQHHQGPKGKLYWKICGLLAKKKKINQSVKRTYNEALVNEDLSAFEIVKEVLNDEISWLRFHNAPESKVFELWQKTADIRLSSLRQSSEHTIADIVLQWPRYRDENGYILIDRDFAVLHPTSADKFSTNWPTVAKKLVLLMKRLEDKEAKQMLSQVTSSDSSGHVSEAAMTVALILLPFLLPEASVATLSSGKGKKRSFWKPSVAESMSYFIDVQKPGTIVSEYLKKKADNMERRGLQMQPHVIALIQDRSKVDVSSCFYAVISRDIYFGVSTAMIAVDICFKAFFVFDTKFSEAARSTWLFLQRAVYEIATNQEDNYSSRVLQLLSDVNCAFD